MHRSSPYTFLRVPMRPSPGATSAPAPAVTGRAVASAAMAPGGGAGEVSHPTASAGVAAQSKVPQSGLSQPAGLHQMSWVGRPADGLSVTGGSPSLRAAITFQRFQEPPCKSTPRHRHRRCSPVLGSLRDPCGMISTMPHISISDQLVPVAVVSSAESWRKETRQARIGQHTACRCLTGSIPGHPVPPSDSVA